MLRAGAPSIARCEQNVWRRTCGPAPFGFRVVAKPDRRVARSIRYDRPFALRAVADLLRRSEFPTVQLGAAKDILDRTEGKARGTVALTGEEGGPVIHVFKWQD